MLRKKLARKATNTDEANCSAEKNENDKTPNGNTSHLFDTTLGQSVFNLECQLNQTLRLLKPDPQITHIYNPVEYAAGLHFEYLKNFLKGRKKLLFVGMNPGHDGMGQTGHAARSIKSNTAWNNKSIHITLSCALVWSVEKYVVVLSNTSNSKMNLCLSSKHDKTPDLWIQFYILENDLNENLWQLQRSPEINYIYNPIEYAAAIHCKFLKKFLDGPKKLCFIGMNPGPNGMMQTGVPFGNISTVKNIMGLHGVVEKPSVIHPKRPINGLQATREEPSGKRLWTLFQRLSNNSLDTFFQQCFVHNFCPLAFFNSSGKNITPSELKGVYKQQIRDTCLNTTDEILRLIQPEIIVAVGSYVFETLKKSEYCKNKRLLLLAHPSPRSLNNNNWPEKAEQFLIKEDLLKYFRNEINSI